MSEKTVDRRGFLKFVFASLVSASLSGCGTANKTYPPLELTQLGATVRIVANNASGYGTSVLTQESNGGLYLYTAGHVARGISQAPGAYAEFYGIGNYDIQTHRITLRSKPGAPEDDGEAFYKLEGAVLSDISRAIIAKKIAACIRVSHTPRRGEEVALPRWDTLTQSIMRYTGFYDFSSNEHTVDAARDGSCVRWGRSGGAVLRMERGGVTNEVIGLVISMPNPDDTGNFNRFFTYNNKGELCSRRAHYRPV